MVPQSIKESYNQKEDTIFQNVPSVTNIQRQTNNNKNDDDDDKKKLFNSDSFKGNESVYYTAKGKLNLTIEHPKDDERKETNVNIVDDDGSYSKDINDSNLISSKKIVPPLPTINMTDTSNLTKKHDDDDDDDCMRWIPPKTFVCFIRDIFSTFVYLFSNIGSSSRDDEIQ